MEAEIQALRETERQSVNMSSAKTKLKRKSMISLHGTRAYDEKKVSVDLWCFFIIASHSVFIKLSLGETIQTIKTFISCLKRFIPRFVLTHTKNMHAMGLTNLLYSGGCNYQEHQFVGSLV